MRLKEEEGKKGEGKEEGKREGKIKKGSKADKKTTKRPVEIEKGMKRRRKLSTAESSRYCTFFS